MVNNKGKSIAIGRETYGKRKRNGGSVRGGEDGDTSRQRKRKNAGVLQFFEDAADVEDDDDDSSDDGGFDINDFVEGEFDMQQKVNSDPGKDHNLPFIPKEEEIDEVEFDKMMEERYKEGSRFIKYAEDDYETKRLTDRDYHILSHMDPIIWKVKCMVGRERQTAFCLMQKFVDLQSLGTKLLIISAFAIEHIKGFIYIEADKQSDIIEACKGLSGIYTSRVAQVPQNEVSHLLSARIKYNEVSQGMWAYVKNGKYKGDLAQVVAVNNPRKRATVKLIPRIDLQALAAKFGGGVTLKKNATTAPRLISSSELDEFRPLIQYKRDRETGKSFEVLDGMMLKDGYLYKKVSIDSLNCWGVVPSEEELLKFKPSDSNESSDLEWLSQLYGEQKKKRTVTVGKGGGKGESSSGSSLVNGSELYELVCFGRKDFGLIVGMEKDDQYKILKEGPEGPAVVTVQRGMLKTGPFDMKFTALDRHMKTISINDTVRVSQGPSKDRQGIVRQIYRGIIFLYDENETENGGYFCSKSQLCEKIKISADANDGKGGGSGASGFEELVSSPKSPLSPKKPWQAREYNSDFKRGGKDGMFAVGQTLRIRVGPLKGYLCRVLAIRYSDITVKLDSQQKVLTVKSEHLAEVRGRSFATSTSEDPGSSTFKPFDMLGTEGCSGDWMNASGTSAEGDRWNAGGSSAERSSWPSLTATGTSLQLESTSANPVGSGDTVPKNDGEDSAWERKVTADQNSSWGAALADGKNADCWNKTAVKNMGSDTGACSSWGNWGNAKIHAVSSNDASASWGKNKDTNDNQDNWKKSDPWDKGKNTIGNSTSSWGDATVEKNQLDSWGKNKDTVEAGSTVSWEKNRNSCMGLDHLNNEGSGWNQQKSQGKSDWSNKDGSNGSKSDWNKAVTAAENPMGSCGNADDGVDGWKQAQGGSGSQTTNWVSPKNSNEDETGWGKVGSGNQVQTDGWNKPKSDPWDKGKNTIENSTSGWVDATAEKNQLDSGGKSKDIVELGSTISWEKNRDSCTGEDRLNNEDSGWNQQKSWGKSEWSNKDVSNGSKSDWNKSVPVAENPIGSCRNAGGDWIPRGGDGESGWKKAQVGSGSQTTNWVGSKNSNENEIGWVKVGSGNQDQTDGWDKTKTSDAAGGSSWNKQDGGSSTGRQDGGWSAWSKQADQQLRNNWNSGSSGADENHGSNWGNKGNWNSGSRDAGRSQDSTWGKKSGDGNQDSSSGKKSSWNSGSGDANQDVHKNGSWNSGSGNVNQDSCWDKKTNWSSGSGDANRHSNWGNKSSWNSGSGSGSDNANDGRDGSYRGSIRGRWGSDRGSFRGRGRSARGGFGGRGRSDRGGFEGRGSSDRGGFGGRGNSNRGGFSGRNGSDRGGFGGRGQGRRDQGGSWNNNDSGEYNSFDSKQGGDDKGQWKSWKSGSGGTSSQAAGWSSQGSAGWGDKADDHSNDFVSSLNKGDGTTNKAGGSQGKNWNSSNASGGGQWPSWKNSNSTKEVKGTNDQGDGWNKGSDSSAQAGCSQSKDTGEGSGGGWGTNDSWGKAAGSSWGKENDGHGKGGW